MAAKHISARVNLSPTIQVLTNNYIYSKRIAEMTQPFKISCTHLISLRVNAISQIKNLTPRAEYI